MTLLRAAKGIAPAQSEPSGVKSASADAAKVNGKGWQFRPDIEGLRAIAIIAVVLFHAGFPIARGGFIGVDVFFVLSGFLITGILVAEVEETGRISLSRFWARRARRLLPAIALISLLVVIAAPLFGSPFDEEDYIKTAIATALYASNVLFLRRSEDYFAEGAASDPLLHTWSLSVEEQFYVAFAPLMLLAADLRQRLRGARWRPPLALVLGALTIVSFVFCVVIARSNRQFAFYMLPARAWEFGIGALLAVVGGGVASRSSVAWNAFAVFAMLALLACFPLLDGSEHPGPWTAVPVLATAVVISAGFNGGTTLSRALGTQVLRVLGRLSYSWYLWHWPLLVLLKSHIQGEPSAWLRLGVVAAALVPAAVTYKILESPIRHSRWLAPRSYLSLAGAGALTALVLMASAGAMYRNRVVLRGPALRAVAEARNERPKIYSNGCQAGFRATTPRLCEVGSDSGPTIVLLGDSHAGQWYPVLEQLAAERSWRLVSVTKSACPWASVTVERSAGVRYGECDIWRRTAIEMIRSENPDVVIVSSATPRRLMVGSRVDTVGAGGEALRTWSAGMETSLRALAAYGTRVLLLRDTPRPGFDVPGCLAKHLTRPEECSFDTMGPRRAALSRVEDSVVARTPGTSLVDLTSAICGGERCAVFQNGILVYYDSHHLSVAFVNGLREHLAMAIEAVPSMRDR